MRLLVSARRALTLVEVAIATALFSVIVFAVATALDSAGGVASVVHNQTTVQLEAQRVMQLIEDQLYLTNTVDDGGDFAVNVATTSPIKWEMTFHKLDPKADIFDESTGVGSVPWSSETYTIRCSYAESGGPQDGTDNDGDYLVDEERIELLEDGVLVAVLGDDLYADLPLSSGIETAGFSRPRLHFRLRVDRLIYGVVKTTADAAAAKAGGGPRVRYIYDTWITLPG